MRLGFAAVVSLFISAAATATTLIDFTLEDLKRASRYCVHAKVLARENEDATLVRYTFEIKEELLEGMLSRRCP